jgi:hypothetical protein
LSEELHDSTAAVDRALSDWRQGDCVLGEQWFVHRADSIGRSSSAEAANGWDLVETAVAGFVLVSQSCDIIRSSKDRPFVEVCPLVQVTEQDFPMIAARRRPVYALIPALELGRLVADLDRTMTVEKAVVAQWNRTPGCRNDVEMRAFAEALSRKRKRFAFPNDFNQLVRKLVDRLSEKHGRASEEGEALRSLREIRVQATPSWDSPEVNLMFWFIPYDDSELAGISSAHKYLEKWLKLIPAGGRFEVFGQIETLERLTAADYLGSDLLDLDHLSS